MKTCYKCQITKSTEYFSKDPSKKDLKSNCCKDCRKAYFKEYHKTHTEEEREYRFPKRYGISLTEIKRQYITQGKKCSICGEKMKLGGKTSDNSVHVDHDHKTGIVRGVICAACNRLLGAAKDNIWTLHKAIEYLSGVKKKSSVIKWP